MIGPHVDDDLLRLSEGRLMPDERRRVAAHLAACPACRAAASDNLQLVDTLQSLPRALRALPGSAGRSWPGVWARVRGLPAPRPSPVLSLYLSLAVAIFVLAASLPGGAPGAAENATAGMAQTPWSVSETPVVYRVDGSGTAIMEAAGPSLGQAASEPAGGQSDAARPIPIPTPAPGSQG